MPWQGKVLIGAGLLCALALSGCDDPVERCASGARVLGNGEWVRCHPAARLSVERLGPEVVVVKCECPVVPKHASIGPTRVQDEVVPCPPLRPLVLEGEVRCYTVGADGGAL